MGACTLVGSRLFRVSRKVARGQLSLSDIVNIVSKRYKSLFFPKPKEPQRIGLASNGGKP
jgi:hypothetical protein